MSQCCGSPASVTMLVRMQWCRCLEIGKHSWRVLCTAAGSGLTVRTKMGPAAQPQVASPVVPVSTPNQALGYGPMPSAPLSAASRTPLHMQSFVAALQQPEPVPQPAVPPVSQLALLPGQASHQVTTGAIALRHSQVTSEAPAAPQPDAPVAQASEQTAATSSGASAVL